MNKWEYSKGLHKVANGIYAYLYPKGQWGFNNAGLIVDDNKALLIDTLFDLESTREMLDTMKEEEPEAAETIDTLVVTHGNGDHFFGNELVKGAEIICTKACAEEMQTAPPQLMAEFIKQAPSLGDLGMFIVQCFGPFNFEDVNPLPATKTFENRMDIKVGNKEIQLIEVGPAHTKGDMIVYAPEDKTIFSGDILFIGGTPIMWAGPVGNWINALDLMLGFDVDTIVPGHGPITDKTGAESIKAYWEFMIEETRKRFDAGMPAEKAAADIDLGKYAQWGESERVIVNVIRLYSEFSGDNVEPNVVELFSNMAGFISKGASDN